MDWFEKLMHHFHHNQDVTEILIQRLEPITLVSQNTKRFRTNPFRSITEFLDNVYSLSEHTEKRLDFQHPFAGGTIQHHYGSFRWHTVVPPMSPNAPILSIRRQQFQQLSLSNFSLTHQQTCEFSTALTSQTNIIIIGPTGVGKTTLLTCLLKNYCYNLRTLILESIEEIPPLSPQWVQLSIPPKALDSQNQWGLDSIFHQSLRLKPEKLVFSEIRSDHEWRVFTQACHSGHACFTTLHGSSFHSIQQRFSSEPPKNTLIVTIHTKNTEFIVHLHKLY